MYGYIYKTKNLVNGKIYIGKKESSEFVSEYKGSGVLIQRAIEKYGLENFVVKKIDEADSLKELNEKEKFWIKRFRSQDLDRGYNIANGGDGGDLISNLPEEKYKEFIKDCKRRAKGKNNPNYGNGHKIEGDKNPSKRKEVRQKLSKKLSGKGNGMYGKTHSRESIDKKINTTLERYGFIPNKYSANSNNWRYFKYIDNENVEVSFIYRTKTELVRELGKKGFSPSVIRNAFDSDKSVVYIEDYKPPKQSKNKHLKALNTFSNPRIEKYKIEDNTEII